MANRKPLVIISGRSQVIPAGDTLTDGSGVAYATGGGSGNPYEAAQVLPRIANFTWVNQGTATVADVSNGIALTAPSAGGVDAWRIQIQTPPAAPYNVIGRTQLLSVGVNFITGGIILRNSGTGRFLVLGSSYNGGVKGVFYRYTNPTTFSATAGGTAATAWGIATPIWFKLAVTSTGATAFFGWDGINWEQFGATEAFASFITSVDGVGFGSDPNSTAADMTCTSFAAA